MTKNSTAFIFFVFVLLICVCTQRSHRRQWMRDKKTLREHYASCNRTIDFHCIGVANGTIIDCWLRNDCDQFVSIEKHKASLSFTLFDRRDETWLQIKHRLFQLNVTCNQNDIDAHYTLKLLNKAKGSPESQYQPHDAVFGWTRDGIGGEIFACAWNISRNVKDRNKYVIDLTNTVFQVTTDRMDSKDITLYDAMSTPFATTTYTEDKMKTPIDSKTSDVFTTTLITKSPTLTTMETIAYTEEITKTSVDSKTTRKEPVTAGSGDLPLYLVLIALCLVILLVGVVGFAAFSKTSYETGSSGGRPKSLSLRATESSTIRTINSETGELVHPEKHM